MKLKEYMLYWYNTYRLPRQQKTTQIVNMSLISNHIVGSDVGELELADVTTRDIQEFLTKELLYGKKTMLKNLDLRGTSLSPHTIIKLRQLLIAMFRQAVQENLILCNVAENTEHLPIPWHDSPVFTPENQ